MATDVQLTGAGFPLEIHGKEYLARTFTDKDHAELDAYVQAEMMRVARDTLTDDMTSLERQEQLSAALSTVSGITWGSREGSRIISSLKGMVRLAWQMIKANHPKLEYDSFYTFFVKHNGEYRDNSDIQKAVSVVDEAFLILNSSHEKSGEVDVDPEEGSTENSKSN